MIAPLPALIELSVPDDGNQRQVDAALHTMVERISNEESEEEPATPDPDQIFYLLYVPEGAYPPVSGMDLLIPIPFSLDPEVLDGEMERYVRSSYVVEGTDGLFRLDFALQFSIKRYEYEGVQHLTPNVLPNSSSFDTLAKVNDAARKMREAQGLHWRVLRGEAAKAVMKVGERAVALGRDRLERVRTTILDETAR